MMRKLFARFSRKPAQMTLAEAIHTNTASLSALSALINY